MSFAFLEYEENVGRLWHRMVGDRASYPCYPHAEARLEDEKRRLAVFFRAMGGDPGLAFGAAGARYRAHRLSVLQRLGQTEERLATAKRSKELVLLPPKLACLPDPAANRDLYTWLAVFFAHATADGEGETDPLRRDLRFLRMVHGATGRALERYPGLRPLHERLAKALLVERPTRRLPRAEAMVEGLVRALHRPLRTAAPEGSAEALVFDERTPLDKVTAPRGYRSFLPSPLWGEVEDAPAAARQAPAENEDPGASTAEDEEQVHRRAERMKRDRSDRDALTLINKGELMLTAAEMVDVSRPDDEDDADSARKAAQDQDTLTLGRPDRRASSRIKMDLDLAPDAARAKPAEGEGLRYPEWDWARGAYRPGYCLVKTGLSPETGEDWRPDAATSRHIRKVRRQFEALRPKREVLRRQFDGDDLDTDAVVRARTDLATTGQCDDKVYLAARDRGRDLCVLLLVDVSLSSDSWVDGKRVLDVEKEALSALAWGLDGCGDVFSILTFTSKRNADVRAMTVKGFEERMGASVGRRIAALKPGHYTRMGAALRHAAALLSVRPEKRRLLLLLSDGKPNDADHYEGRYGVEDTKRAVREARRQGTAVFAVTVDRQAESWVPFIFGRGGAAVIGRLDNLPEALPRIYRQVAVA